MKCWYLVFTKLRKEVITEQNLQPQGWEIYLPRIQQPRRRRGRWITVIEHLFTRYLFVSIHFGSGDISPIRYTPGVHSLVRFNTKGPTVVLDKIFESLQRTADPNTDLHYPMDSRSKSDDVVIIDKDPLVVTQAIFLAKTSQERANELFCLKC